MSVLGGHVGLLPHLDERLLSQTVGDEVFDGDDLQAMLTGKHLQLGHAGHGAVVVHDFHQRAGGVQSGQLAQVDGGLGVATAAQHAVVLGIEGVDVSRSAEGLRRAGGVGEGAYGGGAVVGADARGAAFELVDGDGEGCAQHAGVVAHLARQVEFLAAADGDGCAEHATGILQHEVHHLGGNLLGGADEVALVLAVLVVDNNDEAPLAEVGDGVGDGAQVVHYFVVHFAWGDGVNGFAEFSEFSESSEFSEFFGISFFVMSRMSWLVFSMVFRSRCRRRRKRSMRM